jgi:hypothetical protein
MLATLGIGVGLIGMSLGFSGHHQPATAACCDVCGVESATVNELLFRLQNCPQWRKRDNAAHALRKVSWKCHPEVPAALAYSMLHDCEEEVREESAQSLAKLAPCLPEVHLALQQAACNDPDHATRKWAKRGLKVIGKHCAGECVVCAPGTVVETIEVIPDPATPPIVIPPTELEPIESPPLGRSPFGDPVR